MLAILAESALRALLLGGVVWIGLNLMRVRNPHVHMTCWAMVLVASLSMPLLMRWTTVSCGALAAKPGMLRDVGHANGSNPIKRRPALSPPDRRQRLAGEVRRRTAAQALAVAARGRAGLAGIGGRGGNSR